VNADGWPDAIVGDLNGGFYFHPNSGSGFSFDPEMLSEVALGGWSVPRLIDMDADNDLDIVAGNEAGNLFYFENSGTPSSPVWQETINFFNGIDIGSNCVPTVGDLNLNSNLDVVTGDLFGEVQFFANNEGTWLENTFPVSGISGDQNAAPALADLDNDGDLDLTLGDYDGTLSYYENQFIVVAAENDIPHSLVLELSNYPNPFNPSTEIRFQISNIVGNEPADLAIYNLKGQKIRLYTIAPYQTSLIWDGKNNEGHQVTSGVYFARLKVGELQAVCKMLMMK